MELTLHDKQAVDLAKNDQLLNNLEQTLAQYPPVEMPLTHTFTPGLYVRTIFMPKGTMLTSKIHKTEHQFIITQGTVTVRCGETVETYVAPYHGITKPGTRRALFIHEDTVWTTFHPTTETDLEKIEAELIEPHDIPEQINEKQLEE